MCVTWRLCCWGSASTRDSKVSILLATNIRWVRLLQILIDSNDARLRTFQKYFVLFRFKLGSSKLPYKKILEGIRSEPSWPSISATKLAEKKRYEDEGIKDTRKAVLQLENVEILDENYINKYFGSTGNDSAHKTMPMVSW